MLSPSLSVAWTGKQFVNNLLIGIWRRVLLKRIDLASGRRQPPKVVRSPSQPTDAINLTRWVQVTLLQFCFHKVVYGGCRPILVLTPWQRRVCDRFKRPKISSLGRIKLWLGNSRWSIAWIGSPHLYPLFDTLDFSIR